MTRRKIEAELQTTEAQLPDGVKTAGQFHGRLLKADGSLAAESFFDMIDRDNADLKPEDGFYADLVIEADLEDGLYTLSVGRLDGEGNALPEVFTTDAFKVPEDLNTDPAQPDEPVSVQVPSGLNVRVTTPQ